MFIKIRDLFGLPADHISQAPVHYASGSIHTENLFMMKVLKNEDYSYDEHPEVFDMWCICLVGSINITIQFTSQEEMEAAYNHALALLNPEMYGDLAE